jgi:beta-barrel assembly-enhancing protease
LALDVVKELPDMRTRSMTVALVALLASTLTGQTRINPPSNKYKPEQDVQLGQEAAQEARKQLPIMRDEIVTSYVDDLGRKLVAAIPSERNQPLFKYTFETVNVREINAFALPGGPMFVNRGMVEAASSEGEVAGVMAHEISHVTLRHGTAQASKATKYQAGGIAGAVLGAIIGGPVGNIVAQGTQFGLGAAFMRYGREYEKQADLEGARIMAAAGYDPREMANMFKTIEKQGGSSGPEWLSDHPNPGNRSEYITKEAAALQVQNPVRSTAGFDRVRSHLKSLPAAPTTEEATKAARGNSTRTGTLSREVERPSTRYTEYKEGNVFRIAVPSNWHELQGSNAVTFAPSGAYGQFNNQSVFTHGVEVGIARSSLRDLQQATDDFIQALAKGNPRMSRPSPYRSITLDGRRAIQTSIGNVNDATRENESIQLITTQMRDGNLFYAVAVAPRDEVAAYEQAFQRTLGSIRISN